MPSTLQIPPTRRAVARAPEAQTGQYEAFGNVHARNDLQALIEIPVLIRALRLPCGVRVLEVGCGRGIALPVLAGRLEPSELVGLDIDPELVSEAESRVAGAGIDASVVEGDIRELPFESARFDLVLDFGTCYHVGGGEAGSRRALGEIARVLVPGGLFAHETPVAQHLAHPVRSFGRRLPWGSAPELVRERTALLWSLRRKRA